MSLKSLPSTFDVSRPGPQAVIVVGVSWCGHCIQFKPQLAAMAPKLKVGVYWVDGEQDPRVDAWKVEGYPTIYYHCSAGGLYKYDGPRTLEGIRGFIATVENARA